MQIATFPTEDKSQMLLGVVIQRGGHKSSCLPVCRGIQPVTFDDREKARKVLPIESAGPRERRDGSELGETRPGWKSETRRLT
ncbi:hypothetical protein EYF80_031057 [Liparis tanakae]|uniref:Uncharacterized protein n=1 Tax=Liparis tanakae TaxID=230148 RepID=A0A4Z2H1G0_9TELE|nr:hypothetical protein EYF80_031057 [Liparis tanakae]